MEATCEHRLGLCRSCPGGVWEEHADLSRKGLEVRPGWLGGRRSPKLSEEEHGPHQGRWRTPAQSMPEGSHTQKQPSPPAGPPQMARVPVRRSLSFVGLPALCSAPGARSPSRGVGSGPGTCSLHLCQGQAPAPAGPRRAHGCQSVSWGQSPRSPGQVDTVRRDRTACFAFDFASRRREPLGRRPPDRRTHDATVSSWMGKGNPRSRLLRTENKFLPRR